MTVLIYFVGQETTRCSAEAGGSSEGITVSTESKGEQQFLLPHKVSQVVTDCCVHTDWCFSSSLNIASYISPSLKICPTGVNVIVCHIFDTPQRQLRIV